MSSGKVPNEGIENVHHVGLGITSIEVLEAFKKSLIARGAELVAEIPGKKCFLRLNPEDTLLLELFLTDGEPAFHVDFSVKDLGVVIAAHADLIDYEIPGMRFLAVQSSSDMPLELAFADRAK